MEAFAEECEGLVRDSAWRAYTGCGKYLRLLEWVDLIGRINIYFLNMICYMCVEYAFVNVLNMLNVPQYPCVIIMHLI